MAGSGGSNYLDGAENLYGLPAVIPPGVSEQASAIVDAHLKRPEGMLYVADKNGNPSYMKALTPTFTYQVAGGIAPGSLVTVTVTPAIVRPDMVGEVLVVDRDNPDLAESLVVTATAGNNQLTFATVQFTHAANCKLDAGLVITEERVVPTKRSIVKYSRHPCPAILSLMGRYGYGRRSDQIAGLYQEMNLLASVQTFGGPPQWIPITITQASWSDITGEIWVPAGMLLAYYSEVKLKYVAGFLEPPDPIIRATANVAQSLISGASIGGNALQLISAGNSRIQRFGPTNLDDDSKRLLAPYVARTVY